jgi:hypothetical protein
MICPRNCNHVRMHDLQVILITEHMSSGSLKKFLRKTKKNNRKIPLQSWRRWCTQVFSSENSSSVLEAQVFSCIWLGKFLFSPGGGVVRYLARKNFAAVMEALYSGI